jgi:hypothetical protein
MVEISIQISSGDSVFSDNFGRLILESLQIAATLIGIFYIAYEATYPYLYKKGAVKDRSASMEAKYKFDEFHTQKLPHDEAFDLKA